MPENITLIGMPGAGKSTAGHLLAKLLKYSFIDSDSLICSQQKRSLQDIVDKDGYLQLRQFEEQAIMSIRATRTIISTGGSAVYSAKAMRHLTSLSKIIYLSVPYDVIVERIKNLDTRGLAKKPHQSLHDLYIERTALYEKYAQISVRADRDIETVVKEIREKVV